jgi:hypothetical protein
MVNESKFGMECGEFEALLSEALDGDGRLNAARQRSFDAHRRECAVCGPMFAEAQAGREWLRSLGTVEPPAHLVHNILIATSGVVSKRAQKAAADGGRTPVGEQAREWWDSLAASYFRPVVGLVRQPRFAMSFGMIFFSFR